MRVKRWQRDGYRVPEEAGVGGLLAVVVNLKIENDDHCRFQSRAVQEAGNLHIDVFALAVVKDAGNRDCARRRCERRRRRAFSGC